MGTDLVLFDKYMNTIGVIDEYRSLIWTERWGDLGDFELYMSPKQESINMVMQAMYIARMDDIYESQWKGFDPTKYPTNNNFRSVMVILERTINTSQDGDEVVLKGKEALCLTQRRVIMGHYLSKDITLYQVLIDLSRMLYTTPPWGTFYAPYEFRSDLMDKRKFDQKIPLGGTDLVNVFQGFTLNVDPVYFNDKIPDLDVLGQSIYEAFMVLEKMYGFRHESRVQTMWQGSFSDPQRQMYDQIAIECIPTVDRTVNQLENSPVIISEKYDNLVSSSYTDSFNDYASHVWVAGSLEVDDIYLWHGIHYGDDAYTGALMCEEFVDDTGEKLTNDEGREKTWDELYSKYRSLAREALKDKQRVTIADGEALNYNFIYGTDYFLGDLVTFENKYGITFDARCTEVVHSVDDDGEVVFPSFAAV